MALRRPSPQSAAPAGRLPSGGSPAHADSPPPRSKRPRLDEPGGVGAAGRWPPQVDMLVPGAPSLVPEDVALPQPPAPSAGSPAWADPSAPPRGQTRSCGQPRPPERAGCSRAPERSEERRARDGLAPAVSLGAALCCEEGQAAPHGVNGASKADRVMPSSEKEKSVSPSVLKVSKFENPRNLETSKPSYFRDSITITIPHFPKDLNSNVSFVYLKEKAKKRNDKFVAYVRDFTNIYWSQNRPDAKKRKLQDDKKIVVVENDFSDSYESNQPLNNQNNFEAKRGLISINYYHHNGIKYNVRDFKKNFILTIENDNWEEAEMNSYSYIPTRLGKSQNWDNNVHPILQRKSKDCWIMENVKTNCENMKKLTENLNLVQLQGGDHLNKEDYQRTSISMHKQQSKLQMIGTLSNLQNLIIVQLNDKGQNDNMLQLRYFHLRKHFQSLITEIYYFLRSILGNKKDSSVLTWFKKLKCEKQIGVQNLITRNMNVNIKSGKYLQTRVLEYLHTVVNVYIIILLKNFSCFLRTENDCELQESSIFKWIVQNYLENILMESHTVCLKSILTFSRLFENNLKPNSRKRKLLNTGQALDKSKKQNINSFSVTTKNKSFEIFETYKFFPILMDFDNIEESTLTRESSYENSSHPEQFVDVENWSPYSFNIVNTHVKSGPEFTQNSHRHINEINMNDHDSCTKRKQKHKTSHFNFKFVFEDVFSVKKWVMSSSQNTTHEQMKAMTVTQESSCESLSSEIEEKTYDFIWEKDVKAKAQGLTNSCQLRKDNKMEKEEKDSFPSMDGTYSVQSISLLSKKASVEETQPANKNNGADGNEDKSILHECELANSKYFYPKNDSILYVNCQFESDSSEENNERFQDLTAECLSTEALTIAKDFQMKSKFDLVLEELRMFHEISKENEMLSSVAIYNRKENYLGASNDSEKAKVASQKDLKVAETNTIYISSLSCDMKAGSNMHKKHQSLFKWKAVPNNGEQEATNEYCYPAGPEEELLHATSKEDFKKLPKRRAFCIDECKEEIYNCLMKGGSCFSHGISRVQPLKTCSRPIRVGLSRKATLKQLHPYLK